MVVRYADQDDLDLAFAYQFAANRFREGFRGYAEDDMILFPFLTLYRHAYELLLKSMIRFLVATRALYCEGWSADLKEAVAEDRFKDHRVLGHNLYKLLNEVEKHYVALSLPAGDLKPVERMISMLHEADGSGTVFRYSGQLPKSQDHIDFLKLGQMLNEGFESLSGLLDCVAAYYGELPTLKECES